LNSLQAGGRVIEVDHKSLYFAGKQRLIFQEGMGSDTTRQFWWTRRFGEPIIILTTRQNKNPTVLPQRGF
jgi:hypothetical protein